MKTIDREIHFLELYLLISKCIYFQSNDCRITFNNLYCYTSNRLEIDLLSVLITFFINYCVQTHQMSCIFYQYISGLTSEGRKIMKQFLKISPCFLQVSC